MFASSYFAPRYFLPSYYPDGDTPDTVKEVSIFHTRLTAKAQPLRTDLDPFNPMTVIIDFDHNLPLNYFQEEDDIYYAIFVDNEFDKEFKGKSVKVQLLSQNAVSNVDIFALPHSGFRPDLDAEVPGNKIRLRFRGRNPFVFDVVAHHIQFDNGTGTFIEEEMGVITSKTGKLEAAASLRSSKIIDPV